MLVYVGNIAGVHFITRHNHHLQHMLCAVHSLELHILQGFEQCIDTREAVGVPTPSFNGSLELLLVVLALVHVLFEVKCVI